MPRSLAELIGALEDTWTSTADAVSGLSDDEWHRETGCPGWTVKDNVAHLIGVEREMLGDPVPDHTLEESLPHVRNDFARHMEVAVDLRRSVDPAEVLAEFRDVTGRRLEALDALSPDALDEQVPGPFGAPARLGSLLGIRLFDSWFHEQDIRRAVGRPGGVSGPAAQQCRDRILAGLTRVLAGHDGSADVVVEVAGAAAVTAAYRLGGETVERLDAPPDEPAVRLRMDLATLAALAGGRTDPGPVDIDGDQALGQALMRAMAMTP